jgi:hypothetical protein
MRIRVRSLDGATMSYYSSYTKFHINVGVEPHIRRTTISIETYLAEALAIKLGQKLETPEAHATVRKWIQEQQDKEGRNYEPFLVKRALVLEIMDGDLTKSWWDSRKS